jgi:hypothetical protein
MPLRGQSPFHIRVKSAPSASLLLSNAIVATEQIHTPRNGTPAPAATKRYFVM